MNRPLAIATMVLSALIALVAALYLGVYGIVAAGCFCYVMALCGGAAQNFGPVGGSSFSRGERSLASHYEKKAQEKIEKKQPSDPKELRLWKALTVVFALGLIALGFGLDAYQVRG